MSIQEWKPPEAPKVNIFFEDLDRNPNQRINLIANTKGRLFFQHSNENKDATVSVAAEKIINWDPHKDKLGFIDRFRFSMVQVHLKDGSVAWFKVNKSSVEKQLGVSIKEGDSEDDLTDAFKNKMNNTTKKTSGIFATLFTRLGF